MSLFDEFEKRRGSNPPIPVSRTAVKKEIEDTGQVLRMAFSGQLRHSYLLAVQPEYRDIFTEAAVWLCPDEEYVQRKQQTGQLAFTPAELMDVVQIAARDRQAAVRLVAVKKSFCGIITNAR